MSGAASAARLQTERLACGLSRSQAARLLETSYRVYLRYETGERAISRQVWKLWELQTERRLKTTTKINGK